MALLPYSRRQSERDWDDEIEEPAPRRQRLSPPELTDVLFEIHSDFRGQTCQRRGALSAFLDQQNKPKPGHRARHYSFSFDCFQRWATKWVGYLDTGKWVLRMDGDFFRFDEESSWQSALIGLNHLLQNGNSSSFPRNPTVTIAPLPRRYLKNSPLITGGSHSAPLQRQLTFQQEDQEVERDSSCGRVTTPEEEFDSISHSGSSPEGLFSDEESGFDENDPVVPESWEFENGSVSECGSEDSEESSNSNLSKDQIANFATGEGMANEAQEYAAQSEMSQARIDLLQEEKIENHQSSTNDTFAPLFTTATEERESGATSPTPFQGTSQTRTQDPTSTATASTQAGEEESQVVIEMDTGLSSNDDESSCNEDIDDDMEEEPLGNQGIAPAQQLLFKRVFLTDKQWAEVCTVLDHPVEKRDEGKLLLGTRQSLRIHQMAFIVRAMKAHRVVQELNGLLLADNVGLGKSICALGLFAVTSLTLLNLRHAQRHPEKHLPKKETRSGLKCPSGNIYGIQCVCIPEGITRDYAQQLVYGPSVLAVPASNLDAWARRVSVYFRRKFRAHGSTIDEELVEPLCYRETGQLNPIPLNGKEKPVRKEDLVATPRVSSRRRNSSKSFREVGKTSSKPITYQEAYATYENGGSLYFKSPQLNKAQFRFLILLSFTALGRQTNALSRVFGVQTALPRPNQNNDAGKVRAQSGASIPIVIPFAISVNLFFFDESHSVTNRDTQLFNSFDDIRRLSGISRRRQTRWYFMTATPFSHSPNDIHSCLRLLVGNQNERKKLIAELPNFATRFRRLQPKKPSATKKQQTNNDDTTAQFAQDFANFVRPFTVARDWGSPYLGTCLQDVRPGIKHHVVRVSVPPDLEKAVERLGARCRKELTHLRAGRHRELELGDVTGIKIFTQFFSAGIAPGIAEILEQKNGHLLPTSVKRVDEDFRLGQEGVLRETLHFHEGHEWTKKLAEIIKLAHSGGKTQSQGQDNSTTEDQNPCHILLVAQTPVLVGLIVRFIEEDPELNKITRAKRIFQSVTPKPAGRDTLLRSLEKEAAESDRTYILVTTPRLIGVGVDIVFCSYVVQFGEIFSNREREQLIGRVNRPGQRLTVHHWHIMSTHRAHALVRERNNGRSVMLSEHGLVDIDVEGGGDEVVEEETQQVISIDGDNDKLA